MRTAILLPGQGIHLPGALIHLRRDATVADVLDAVDATTIRLPHRISHLLTRTGGPTSKALFAHDPLSFHVATFTAVVALGRVVLRHLADDAVTLLGHSVGELAALAVAGSLRVEDGARFLLARHEAIAQIAPPPGGLLVVTAPECATRELVHTPGLPDVALAADNAPSQTVVSGPDDQLKAFAAVAAERGHTATRLSGADMFHNELLSPAAAALHEYLHTVPVAAPSVPIWSPLLRRPYANEDELRAAPAHHLTRPAHLRTAMLDLHSTGVRRFIDTGPRDVVAKLAKATLPEADVTAVARKPVPPDHVIHILRPRSDVPHGQ